MNSEVSADDGASRRMKDLREGARQLGISPYTLRAWARQRKIAFHKLGRRLIFDSRDLDEFVRQHRVAALDDSTEVSQRERR